MIKLQELDSVITPDGIGRVEIVHPEGVLGKDGRAPKDRDWETTLHSV